MRRRISYTMELSTTRYFWPRYVLASLIPEPYWLRRRVTRSASQGSGLGPSGLGAGLAAAGAAGLAAAGAVGFSPAAGAAAAGLAGPAVLGADGASALAAGERESTRLNSTHL